MRCKKCAKTFRTPPYKMRETQICSVCSQSRFTLRNEETMSSDIRIEGKHNEDRVILDKDNIQELKSKQIKNKILNKLKKILENQIMVIKKEQK